MTSSIDLADFRKAQRAQGPATILAIGTATPVNCIYQADFPDFYFRITKSEHMIDLKEKMKRMCNKSMIKKRYMNLTEEFLKENPNICEYMAPSLDTRQDLLVVEVPKLGKEAAIKAIKEWDHPKTNISHLIFSTTSGVDLPGADYQLSKLLDLNPSVKRYMMYKQGCYSGVAALRLAKDLAENSKGARVLLVCCDISEIYFRGPSYTDFDSLLGQVLFGDGAGAIIVGSDLNMTTERPLFQIVSANQTILPDSDGVLVGQVKEGGLVFHIDKKLPNLVSNNLEKALIDAFSPLGITDWNSLFWIMHPGGPSILDKVQIKLGLKEEKMRVSRDVLSEYGNMWGVSVFFIMDEMRKKSADNGDATTGEGLDWGVMFGLGPGVTLETVVLHSLPTTLAIPLA